MALTKCKDCGKEISKKAKACPGCGRKKKNVCTEIAKGLFALGFLLFFAAILIPIVLYMCS